MKAKKSLGQNWLKSETAIQEIIKTADLNERELVLEIGPGQGKLTEALLSVGATVVAIEKDDRLIEVLTEKFAAEIKVGRFILIHDDILNLDFSSLFSSLKTNRRKLIASYCLVANIPYYLTGQIIRKFLSQEKIQPTKMVLMLQKEVAKRIVAGDGKESLLSLSVKAYGEPKYIKTVPAGAFVPKPKVDSAILLIHN
ncbi:MAG TPA: 16S rRNA (adenine(1518)-N(6)/adenine(1519)-N(6))-dimethyltransferase RsmA, partial [Candidatus Paceibacterota bacterium]|nr:16S rRNA (adenine(1518)-N(6)/adenine(1519)-N(6))-dimethyltransferase RsmA [Candidatus Paceibacterota bacterium]